MLDESLIIDVCREARTGFPEAVFGAGKTTSQILTAFRGLLEKNGKALATKCSGDALSALKEALPECVISEIAGLAYLKTDSKTPENGTGGKVRKPEVAVLCAGTSDLPVAEEAALTLEFADFKAIRLYDVGVAGIHRLLKRLPSISSCSVAIVCAGMEGALPSVVGGLTGLPIIAVPTSIGYGASFNGLASLLAMLNSCAPGVTVVNIDNGFGAAVASIRILREIEKMLPSLNIHQKRHSSKKSIQNR